jgi:uncharacterized membrane protein (UPF0127 family)
MLALAGRAAGAELQTFDRDALAIESAAGTTRISVELAKTPEQREQGLMFRRRLAADAGMLFLYPEEQPINMWMKNTVIPLDMLFIASDGRIVGVAERAVPLSTVTIPSGQPARAVLEVNGGTAARLRIKPGDRVLYAAFGTAE